jgi:hypothetical protein
MFIAIFFAVLLSALWLPSWIALYFVRGFSARLVIRKAWPIWLLQLVLAATLIFMADAIGLRNPAGFTLAICLVLGGLGTWTLLRLVSAKRT